MKRWITIIPRNNTPDVKENVVYEANWPQNYHTIIDFGKLHPLDPLLVFDSIKSSLLSFVPSAHKIRIHSETRSIIADELLLFEQKDRTEDMEILAIFT